MRAVLTALAIASGLGISAAAGAANAAVELNFTGVCSDCTGNSIGTLTLTNLPSGALTKADFVNFIYKSSLVSFQINSADVVAVMGSIDPSDLSKSYIDILQLGGSGWEFDRNADGTWSVSNAITFGRGTSQGGGGGGGGGGDGPVVGMGLTHATSGNGGVDDPGTLGQTYYQGSDTQMVNDDFGGSSSVDSRIAAAAVVPEPATWGLMIVGFAGMGALLRNRRRTLAGIETA